MPLVRLKPKFGIQDLESQTKEKGIKVKLTVAYSLEINGIAKRTNGLVISKAKCLFLNISIKIGQSFWLETFTIC